MFGSCYCQFVSAVVHSHFLFSFTNAHVQLALCLPIPPLFHIEESTLITEE